MSSLVTIEGDVKLASCNCSDTCRLWLELVVVVTTAVYIIEKEFTPDNADTFGKQPNLGIVGDPVMGICKPASYKAKH